MMTLAKWKGAAVALMAAVAAAGGLAAGAGPGPAGDPEPAAGAGPTPDDKEFLARVCRDLRGTPPTAVETGYFVADRDAGKRKKVVGWLTAGPEPAGGGYLIEPPDVLRIEAKVGTAIGDPILSGDHQVWPTGSVNLGRVGAVRVGGLDLDSAAQAVRDQLLKAGQPAGIAVTLSVARYNSKRCYVLVEGAGGETVFPFPVSGAETATVADYLGRFAGLPADDRRVVWVGRQNQVLAVDWEAVVRDGQTATNHVLRPGDRLHVRGAAGTPPAAPKLVRPAPEPTGGGVTVGPDISSYSELRLSPPAEEFLGRVYGDLGALPTRVEREYFLADGRPDKAAKLLDLLLTDPAVAKKAGPGWKEKMLAGPARSAAGPVRPAVVETWAPMVPARLDALVGQLLASDRPPGQVLDALSAAALGRLPTDAERALTLAAVGKNPDKPAAWREVAAALAGTAEARAHADGLKAAAPKK